MFDEQRGGGALTGHRVGYVAQHAPLRWLHRTVPPARWSRRTTLMPSAFQAGKDYDGPTGLGAPNGVAAFTK